MVLYTFANGLSQVDSTQPGGVTVSSSTGLGYRSLIISTKAGSRKDPGREGLTPLPALPASP